MMPSSAFALRLQEPRELRELEELRALGPEVLARRALVGVVREAADAGEAVGVVADVDGRRLGLAAAEAHAGSSELGFRL
jgi:hypothetical protein